MTSQELYGQVRAILIDTLGAAPADVTPDATYGALGLDSLDVVELVLIVEEQLAIRVDDEELQSIRTLQQLADLLAAKRDVAV